MIKNNNYEDKIKNTCLLLYGTIYKIQYLEASLSFYSNVFPNIVLITFDKDVNKYIDMIFKYINKENLILIPTANSKEELINKGIKNPVFVQPHAFSNPNNKFYCDGDWFNWVDVHSIIDKKYFFLKKKYWFLPCYKYLNSNLCKKKYDYILNFDIGRFDFNIDNKMMNNLIERADKNKIVVMSIKKENGTCFRISRGLGEFTLAAWLTFSKYEYFYDMTHILCNNNVCYKSLCLNGESTQFGTYIYKKENINTIKSMEKKKKLINKYFDFYESYDFKNNKCFNCICVKKNIDKFIYKKRTYDKWKEGRNVLHFYLPCSRCKKNVFDTELILFSIKNYEKNCTR